MRDSPGVHVALPLPPRSLEIARRARRALRKPPRELARRLLHEAQAELERVRAPRRARRFDERTLLRAVASESIDALWERLARRPFVAVTDPEGAAAAVAVAGGRERILAASERALAREVDLLGSGPCRLGRPIDWHTDFKTGLGWPRVPARELDVADLGRPSDVKVPWELGRLQWLLPVGQAYLLTGDEQYAEHARDVLEEWVEANPYGVGVNWTVAMEAAIRTLSWSWLFHVFARSDAWADGEFRRRFLTTLYLHGDFVRRNLERSDVNGNHYTADACGLVFAGLFFGGGDEPARWAELGWRILNEELPRQVHEDGVDFEASTAYHRLVAELFLLPALYRRRLGLDVPRAYSDRLRRMAAFAAAYTRADGTSPLWGDADDARALPLGGQPLSDHRYLAGLVTGLGVDAPPFAGSREEVAWTLGAEAAAALTDGTADASAAFGTGGVVVMRGGDHVFVDCGPVGLAGRGGHGHNDCLAFEAALDGTLLVSDSGSYVYTASADWRNRFRSTGFHSTPQVDGEEQNRFVEGSLWLLQDDAAPELRTWEPGQHGDRLVAAHRGYRRLADPVTLVRTFELDRGAHRLVVVDEAEGDGDHDLVVPLQLAAGVVPKDVERGRVVLVARGRAFRLAWGDPADWELAVEGGWISPSYGVKHEAPRLVWRRSGPLRPLRVELEPERA